MKGPRASCEGYLTLRTSPSSPPPMERRYCFLVGTSFYYYSTQEDAYHLLRLKGEVDVLGVQEWDGKGNMHIYTNGFLFATAQNKVFYAYADTPMEKEKWMRAIQMCVETTMPRWSSDFFGHSSSSSLSASSVFENATISPSNVTAASSMNDSGEMLCQCPHCHDARTTAANLAAVAAAAAAEAQAQAGSSASASASASGASPAAPTNASTTTSALLYRCHNCEELFCEKFTTNKIPLPHRTCYSAKRVCDDCYEAQMLLNYLKAITERLKAGICLYPKPLNMETPIELIQPKRPSHTEAATIAIDMLKKGLITAEECEVILMADRRYLDQTLDQPEIPLDLKILTIHREFRMRNFGVYRAVILLHRHLESDPLLFKPIVEKLYHFSFTKINQLEFYWPQIFHAYLMVPMFDFEKIFWLDELILSVCSRSIHLALHLRWQLQGALEDSFNANAPREMQDKYARVVRLMVEIEQVVVGTDRRTILGREFNMKRERKGHSLPMPTEEQLALIESYMDEINTYRAEAHGMIKKIDHATISFLYETQEALEEAQEEESHDGNLNRTGSAKAMSATEIRFRDFSRFQQHLLTPREDPNLSLLLATMEESKLSGVDEDEEEDEKVDEEEIFTGTVRRMSQAEKSVLAQHFGDECDLVHQITEIAERLRLVSSVPERKKLLPTYLENIHLPPMAYVPLVKATDPFERIIHIPPKEGTAFSTKARVLVMLIFEVIRGDITEDKDGSGSGNTSSNGAATMGTGSGHSAGGNSGTSSNVGSGNDSSGATAWNGQQQGSPSRRSGAGIAGSLSSVVDYVEDEEVGRLISRQSPNAFKGPSEAELDEEMEESLERTAKMLEHEAIRLKASGDDRNCRTPNAPPPPLHMEVPETPTEVDGTIVTPPSRPDPVSKTMEASMMSAANDSRLPKPASTAASPHGARTEMDLSDPKLMEEAIEKDKARRKELEAAFGESWSSKRKRLQESSAYGHLPGWDIVSVFGKSNDDMRQEVFTLQLIQKFIEIFKARGLPIWLKCYRIIATSSSTGIMETLTNAISLDGLKKREGYVSLLNHFEKSYGPVGSRGFVEAQKKFIRSLAGYSLVCYFLQIKDRHNGNIMLDNEGHLIHIDYGFVLGIAPGGSWSIETAPFKLTYEMVELMGGTESDGFKEYVTLCTHGFLACQQNSDEICDLVEIMAKNSPYPCFAGKDVAYLMLRLRSRFRVGLSKQDTVAHVLSLIRRSNNNYNTRQYDNFQRMTNGILP